MKFKIHSFSLLLIGTLILSFSCDSNKKESTEIVEESKERLLKVKMITDYGPVLIELYNETPKHRDNFKKLVEDGSYDSILFHRVIEGFMVQAGDPDSKQSKINDRLGNNSIGEQVPAEMDTSLFHKRGALAAARDGNPDRASSGSQFYIVHGRVYNDSTLDFAEGRINNWLAEHYTTHDSENKVLYDSLKQMINDEDMDNFRRIKDSISILAKTYKFEKYRIPEAHRKVYKSMGGAAHLDQNYTVFGEVIEGMAVIDSIATQEVGEFNRPKKNIRIISMEIIED